MSEVSKGYSSIDDHIGCFGEYNLEDTTCKKACALRLRCAIEHYQNSRLEIIEDLVAYDSMNIKLQ